MSTDVSMVIWCYVSVSVDVCGVAVCLAMCLWSTGVMCVWCCSVFTDVSMVILCYVYVCGYVCGVALWSSGVMCL